MILFPHHQVGPVVAVSAMSGARVVGVNQTISVIVPGRRERHPQQRIRGHLAKGETR